MWIDPCEEAERHFRACDKQEAAIRDSERAAVLREVREKMEEIHKEWGGPGFVTEVLALFAPGGRFDVEGKAE